MSKKKVIMIIVCICIIIAIVLGIYFIVFKNNKSTENQDTNNAVIESEIKKVDTYIGELSDGTQINTNAKMNKSSSIGDMEVDNIRLTLKNGITTFRASVTNTGASKIEMKSVTLILFNENGEEMVSAKGIISSIDVGETEELGISVTSNYINAVEYKIVED